VMVHAPSACGDEGPASYISRYDYGQDACVFSLTTSTYRAGQGIASPPATIYVRDAESCYETTVTGDFFELEEVSADELALIDETVEPRGDGLEVSFFESEDGFRLMRSALRDTVHEVACYPGALGDSRVCVPSVPSGWRPAFSDELCTTELSSGAVAYGQGCDKPTLAYVNEPAPPELCEYTAHIFQVGADTGPAYALFGPQSCGPLGEVDAEHALLGAQVPDSDFPALEQIDEGSGTVRLRADYAAGAPVTPYGQWVTESGAQCFAYAFSDGVTRCGPPTRAYVPPPEQARYFADAACTELLAEIYDDPCLDIATLEWAVVAEGGCGGLAPHALGAQHSGAIFAQGGGTPCAPATPADAAVYFLVGAEASFDQFGAITTETL